MACNKIPSAYPSLVVHLTEAEGGATGVGPSLPLLINTAANIGEDRAALRTAQKEYRAARSAIAPLSAARKAAVNAAYEFAFKTRDMLENFLGREWSELWIETGWVSNLIIPQGFDDLYELSESLVDYFTANPARQNEELDITIEAVTDIWNDLRTTNQAVLNAEALSLAKKDVRDAKKKAARKRLNGLCKELSQRLDDMDPRWRNFGFNLPGAPTVPEIPEDVVITPLPGRSFKSRARLRRTRRVTDSICSVRSSTRSRSMSARRPSRSLSQIRWWPRSRMWFTSAPSTRARRVTSVIR